MIVRQATLDDRPAIHELVRAAYAGRDQYKIPKRWQWQFCDNPFWSGPGLPIWIALDGDRVVGQTGAMIEPIKFGDAATTVAWSVDTHVLPKYRGQGVGHRLQEASQHHHGIFMSLAMSPRNRTIKASLGARMLRPMELFELRCTVPRHRVADGIRRRIGRWSCAASAVGLDRIVAASVTRLAKRRWQRRSGDVQQRLASLQVTAITRFDERFDEFWSRHRQRYDMAVERTSKYLNWKFCSQPYAAYRSFIAERDDRLVGYVVFRAAVAPEPPVGSIADVLLDSDNPAQMADLVVAAVDALRNSGVDGVRVGTSLPALASSLRRLGFRPTRTYIPMCYARDLRVADDAVTLFGLGDHDLDQVPRRK